MRQNKCATVKFPGLGKHRIVKTSPTLSVEKDGDVQFLEVYLYEGQKYRFLAKFCDPVEASDYRFVLRDSSFVVLEDSSADKLSKHSEEIGSSIEFQARQTGVHYLAYRRLDGDVGQDSTKYNVEIETAGSELPTYSVDEIAQYLKTGPFGGKCFSISEEKVITYNVEALSQSARDLAEKALKVWEDLIDIRFNPATEEAQINFFEKDIAGGYAIVHDKEGVIEKSDVYVGSEYSGGGVGDWAFLVYIHEIGHALGLGHGGDYNGYGTYGIDNHYVNDTTLYTAMSYYSKDIYGEDSHSYPQTPMIADIVAVQSMYGKRDDTRSGDTVYGFASNAGEQYNFLPDKAPLLCTIYDRGGVDVLNVSIYEANQSLDLRKGGISDVGGQVTNLVIAQDTVIEGAISGSGNDSILGNDADNLLAGNDGDDSLYGRGGNDLLYGGKGRNTLYGGEGYDVAFCQFESERVSRVGSSDGAVVISSLGLEKSTHVEYDSTNGQMCVSSFDDIKSSWDDTKFSYDVGFQHLLGDFDGDHRTDAVWFLKSDVCFRVDLLLDNGVGAGGYGLSWNVSAPYYGSQNALLKGCIKFVGDVDEDQRSDLLLYDTTDSKLYVMYSGGEVNEGRSLLSDPVLYEEEPFRSVQGVEYVCDIDDDGDTDILRLLSDGVFVTLNEGQDDARTIRPTSSGPDLLQYDPSKRYVMGEFDGDVKGIDIAVVDGANRSVDVYSLSEMQDKLFSVEGVKFVDSFLGIDELPELA